MVWLAILGAVLAVTLLLSGTLSVGAFGGPIWGGYPRDSAIRDLLVRFGSLLHCPVVSHGREASGLIFVFAGRGLRIIRTRMPRPAVIGAGLVTLSTVLVITRISAPLDIKPGNFGTPILSALAAVMTSAGIIRVAEAVIPRLLGWVSRLSMTLAAGGMLVVLTHPAVLWALNTPDHGRTVGFLAALPGDRTNELRRLVRLTSARHTASGGGGGCDRPWLSGRDRRCSLQG